MTSTALDTLDFVRAERVGGVGQAARSYHDHAINGRPLRALVEVGDFIGVFGWLDGKSEGRFARQLLLREPSQLDSGRVPLYICPECGDLGCGALTTRVVEDHDSFAWTELGFEANYGDPPTEFLEVRAFHFAKEEYTQTIRRFWPRGR